MTRRPQHRGRARHSLVFGLIVAITTGCKAKPVEPSPGIVISNLKSHVLGSAADVCGGEPDVSITQFTFDFSVQGVDLGTGTSVYRIVSPDVATGDADLLGPLELCASGPCSETRRACITAGRADKLGTIELSATEALRPHSSWTIEVRRDDPPVRSNPLTTIVQYQPE